VSPIVADYTADFRCEISPGTQACAVFGFTIGNFEPSEAAQFRAISGISGAGRRVSSGH